LRVALPDLAGCGSHGHHGFTIGAPSSPDFSPSRAADHGGSELPGFTGPLVRAPGFGSLSPNLSVSLLSLSDLSIPQVSPSISGSHSLYLTVFVREERKKKNEGEEQKKKKKQEEHQEKRERRRKL
jgi:hypothetical protein